jgi:hypothetical protein
MARAAILRANILFVVRGPGSDCRSAALPELRLDGSARTTEVCGVRVGSAGSEICEIAKELVSAIEK